MEDSLGCIVMAKMPGMLPNLQLFWKRKFLHVLSRKPIWKHSVQLIKQLTQSFYLQFGIGNITTSVCIWAFNSKHFSLVDDFTYWRIWPGSIARTLSLLYMHELVPLACHEKCNVVEVWHDCIVTWPILRRYFNPLGILGFPHALGGPDCQPNLDREAWVGFFWGHRCAISS